MEECPGPVLPFCRQPESEQEQLACGSSRGEQQFGSVWFHGVKTPSGAESFVSLSIVWDPALRHMWYACL